MRVFLIIRLVFFAILLTSLSFFVFHKTLCINLKPNGIESLSANCMAYFKTATVMNHQKLSEIEPKNREKRDAAIAIFNLERGLEFNEVKKENEEENVTTTIESPRETTPIKKKITPEGSGSEVATSSSKIQSSTIEKLQAVELENKLEEEEELEENDIFEMNSTIVDKFDLIGNEKWHKVIIGSDSVNVNTRTCFEYDFMQILVSDSSEISRILIHLRLPFIFLITSLLLAVLDFSARLIFVTKPSLIQVMIHNAIQFIIWTFILIRVEVFRRNWNENWEKYTNYPAPGYPTCWKAFEFLSFSIIILSIFDVLSYKITNAHIRIENSEGVYKCIEMKCVDQNGTFRSLPDFDIDDE